MDEVQVTSEIVWRDSLGRFAKQIDEGADLAVTEAVGKGAEYAKIICPKDTGHTASTIDGVFLGSGKGAIVAGGATKLLESGTRPHVIESKEGPFGILANKRKNFFSRHAVMHPGTKPNDFLSKALAAINREIMDLVKKRMPG